MRRFLLALTIALVLPSLAWAQVYPVKQVSLLAGFAAGEPGDTVARILSKFAPASLGQPLNVTNVPGDGGMAAMEALLTSAPDGYTLSLCGVDTLTLRPNMATPPFGSPHLYTAVATVAESPICLAVKADSPFRDTKGFLEAAGKNPATLTMGDAGKGSAPQMVSLVFASKVQKRWKPAHFDSAAESVRALADGKVDAVIQQAAAVLPLVKQGKVRVLGVFTEKPVACLPGATTLRSQGYGVAFINYIAVLAPTGMVPGDVAKLDASFKAALADEACAQTLREAGFEPLYEGPNFIASRLRRDYINNAIFAGILREN